MSFIKSQIGEIAYNPAREAFEALVSFHTSDAQIRVPASFSAPLTAEFATISNGLFQDALRKRATGGAMQSQIEEISGAVEPLKAA